MPGRPEGMSGPPFAACAGRDPVFAALFLVACSGRAHIEALGPTLAPSASDSSAAAGAPRPESPGAEPTTSATPGTLPPPSLRASRGTPCSDSVASALSELACELSSGLGAPGSGVTVAAAPVTGQPPSSRAADLSTRIATYVAAALGGAARPIAGAVSLEQARATATSSHELVYVSGRIAEGRLRVSAQAFSLAAGRSDATTPIAHAEAVRRLDGELGSYLPHVTLGVTRAERVQATGDVVALACGDVLGNGTQEIVAVGRHKVQIGRAGDGRFTVRVEAAWANLSPVAPSPLREPIGAAVLLRGRVLVGLSDRADGVVLSASLAPLGMLTAPVPWEHVGCLSRNGIALGTPRPCSRSEHGAVDAAAVENVDAIASGSVVETDGKVARVVAFRSATTRAVTLRDDRGRSVEVPSAGGALALADVDLDGQPELLASLDTDQPDQDAVVVSTWGRDGTVTERLRMPVKDGIHALAVCPVEELRMANIVVATGGGLWIAR